MIVIPAGGIRLVFQERRIFPVSWWIVHRKVVLSAGKGMPSFFRTAWHIVTLLNEDGLTADAGALRELLLAYDRRD